MKSYRISMALWRARLRQQWLRVPWWGRIPALLLLALGGGALVASIWGKSSELGNWQLIFILFFTLYFLPFFLALRVQFPGLGVYQPPVKGRVVAHSDFGERVEEVEGQLYLVSGQRGGHGRTYEYRDLITREYLKQALNTSVWKMEAVEVKEPQPLKGKKFPQWVHSVGLRFLVFIVPYLMFGCLLVFGVQQEIHKRGPVGLECAPLYYLIILVYVAYTPFAFTRFNKSRAGFWGTESTGKVIARSVSGERVELLDGKHWLVRVDGSRDEVTQAWLEQALEGTAWRREGETAVEMPPTIAQEREQVITPQPMGSEVKTETLSEHDRMEAERAILELWETEIASDLSFHDRVTPDMLSHVPLDKRSFALQEYARLHPDEAHWDGEVLVRKGKT